ncbi:DUF4185 domain-containing protein [Micropruina sp.]|uniref:DUF4185 domain-containing protein n=1 Tax=Micropruina sp. TaxID=2737536 RepID=UPI0039E3FC11
MQVATPALIGPASLLESDDRPSVWSPPGAPHRLEAVVGSANGDGTLTVHHYFRGQGRPDNPWLRGDAISTRAVGPGELHQRGRPGTARHELLARIPEPDGVRTYAWAVNEPAARRWHPVADASIDQPPRPAWDGPTDAREWGTGTVIAVATAATRLRNGWVQALVQVDGSIYHLQRQLRRGRVRWLRHACLRLHDPEPFVVADEPSHKVAQVTGERDGQHSASGTGRPTLSSSLSRSGVRGTDLGVRVDHAGDTYLLFGDTHWTRPWLGTRDAVGLVPDPEAEHPEVCLHGSPLRLRGGGTTMREYDVPLDGFSLSDDLFVFHTSNHFRDAQVMGRSVLTRARPGRPRIDPAARWRPVELRYLTTFSDHRFINVSVQRIGEELLLWGTGAYRADDVRLARVDLTAPGVVPGLRRGRAEAFAAAVRYWAGPGRWSGDEADARPLTPPGAHGELSVRWVPALSRYLMLTMSGPDDPIGAAVVLRTAPEPWGPWSPRIRLFDWVGDGMGSDDARRFIRASLGDAVGDAIFAGQAEATGAAYAPYLFDARPDGDEVVLRYTLSTWNPYQVVLMRQRLAMKKARKDC